MPEGSQWFWEFKLDGYRALAVKSGNDVTLLSRRRKSLSRQFPYIVERLADLPDRTVVDGELVAIIWPMTFWQVKAQSHLNEGAARVFFLRVCANPARPSAPKANKVEVAGSGVVLA